jgi:hypothetical protein
MLRDVLLSAPGEIDIPSEQKQHPLVERDSFVDQGVAGPEGSRSLKCLRLPGHDEPEFDRADGHWTGYRSEISLPSAGEGAVVQRIDVSSSWPPVDRHVLVSRHRFRPSAPRKPFVEVGVERKLSWFLKPLSVGVAFLDLMPEGLRLAEMTYLSE